MDNWKIIIAGIGLVASLIGIFSFFSLLQSIYEVIGNKDSSTYYKEIENDESLLKDGIYIDPCGLRSYPSIIKGILSLITPWVGGDNDYIYVVSNSEKKLFLTVPLFTPMDFSDQQGYRFNISKSVDNKRFIVNFGSYFHIANLDGEQHHKYALENGYIDNITFNSSDRFTANLYQDNTKKNINFAQYSIKEPGLYLFILDQFNNIIQTNKK